MSKKEASELRQTRFPMEEHDLSKRALDKLEPIPEPFDRRKNLQRQLLEDNCCSIEGHIEDLEEDWSHDW